MEFKNKNVSENFCRINFNLTQKENSNGKFRTKKYN